MHILCEGHVPLAIIFIYNLQNSFLSEMFPEKRRASVSLSVCFFSLTQVSVVGQNAEGMGPSKKVAKRNAAEKMLELLGFKVPQPQPPKPALKTDEKVSVCLLTAFSLHLNKLIT